LLIPLPEAKGRKEILRNLMETTTYSLTNNDFDEIAEMTEGKNFIILFIIYLFQKYLTIKGYSGADMSNLVYFLRYLLYLSNIVLRVNIFFL